MTITDTELITVHAVNTRVTGALDVVKAVRGDASDTATSFDIVLDCDDDFFDTAVARGSAGWGHGRLGALSGSRPG